MREATEMKPTAAPTFSAVELDWKYSMRLLAFIVRLRRVNWAGLHPRKAY